MPSGRELNDLLASEQPSAEASLLTSEVSERVRKAVLQLPPSYRLVLVLHDMEELSDQEIAKITGLRVFAGPLAGIFRMPYPRFILFNFGGATIWGITVVSVGFLFGGSWDSLGGSVEKFHELTLLGVAAVVLAGVLIYLFKQRKRDTSSRGQ